MNSVKSVSEDRVNRLSPALRQRASDLFPFSALPNHRDSDVNEEAFHRLSVLALRHTANSPEAHSMPSSFVNRLPPLGHGGRAPLLPVRMDCHRRTEVFIEPPGAMVAPTMAATKVVRGRLSLLGSDREAPQRGINDDVLIYPCRTPAVRSALSSPIPSHLAEDHQEGDKSPSVDEKAFLQRVSNTPNSNEEEAWWSTTFFHQWLDEQAKLQFEKKWTSIELMSLQKEEEEELKKKNSSAKKKRSAAKLEKKKETRSGRKKETKRVVELLHDETDDDDDAVLVRALSPSPRPHDRLEDAVKGRRVGRAGHRIVLARPPSSSLLSSPYPIRRVQLYRSPSRSGFSAASNGEVERPPAAQTLPGQYWWEVTSSPRDPSPVQGPRVRLTHKKSFYRDASCSPHMTFSPPRLPGRMTSSSPAPNSLEQPTSSAPAAEDFPTALQTVQSSLSHSTPALDAFLNVSEEAEKREEICLGRRATIFQEEDVFVVSFHAPEPSPAPEDPMRALKSSATLASVLPTEKQRAAAVPLLNRRRLQQALQDSRRGGIDKKEQPIEHSTTSPLSSLSSKKREEVDFQRLFEDQGDSDSPIKLKVSCRSRPMPSTEKLLYSTKRGAVYELKGAIMDYLVKRLGEIGYETCLPSPQAHSRVSIEGAE